MRRNRITRLLVSASLAIGVGGATAAAAIATTAPTTTTTSTTAPTTSANGWWSYPTATAGSTTTTTEGTAGTAAPDASSLSPVVHTFNCQCFNGQKTLAYRENQQQKVQSQHNLDTNSVQVPLAGPDNSRDNSDSSGQTGIALADANREENGSVQTITVRVVYNVRILSDKRSYGVVTAYCEGYQGACPDWVNQILG
jgi:hypothetical protein